MVIRIFSMHSTSAHSQKKSAVPRMGSNALLTSSTRSFTRRNSASLRAARSLRGSGSAMVSVPVRFADDVVPVERPDYLLTFAPWMPGDHHEVARLRGDAFPLLVAELDTPVAELVGALAEERNAVYLLHLLVHQRVQALVPHPEELLVRLAARLAEFHNLHLPRWPRRKRNDLQLDPALVAIDVRLVGIPWCRSRRDVTRARLTRVQSCTRRPSSFGRRVRGTRMACSTARCALIGAVLAFDARDKDG